MFNKSHWNWTKFEFIVIPPSALNYSIFGNYLHAILSFILKQMESRTAFKILDLSEWGPIPTKVPVVSLFQKGANTPPKVG
jgi:hypothetical protein